MFRELNTLLGVRPVHLALIFLANPGPSRL